MYLKINNNHIDLPLDLKVRLDFFFPYPDKEQLPAARVYWFDLPKTNNNIKSFQFANLLIVNRTKVYDCNFGFCGLDFFGKAFLKESNENFRICITFNVFTDPNISSKKLNELTYDDDIILGDSQETIEQTINNLINTSSEVAFPLIYNPNFYAEKKANNEDFAGFINNYNGLDHTIIRNTINQNPVSDNINCMIPMFKLTHILEQVFQHNFEYQVFGNFFDDIDIQKLIVYNNYSIDGAIEKYNGHATINQAKRYYISDIIYPSYLLFENTVLDAENCFEIFEEKSRYNVKEAGYYSVEMRLVVTIDKIDGEMTSPLFFWTAARKPDPNDPYAEGEVDGMNDSPVELEITQGQTYEVELNYEFELYLTVGSTIHFFMTTKLNALYILEMTIQTGYLKVNSISRNSLNVFSKSIQIKNHVPQQSISEVLNSLSKLFSLATFFNSQTKEIEFDFLQNIIETSDYIDLTDNYIIDSESIELTDPKELTFVMDFENDSLPDEKYKEKQINSFSTTYLLPKDYKNGKTINEKLWIEAVNICLNVAKIKDENQVDRIKTIFYRDTIEDLTVKESVDYQLTKEEIKPGISTLMMRWFDEIFVEETDKNFYLSELMQRLFFPAIKQEGYSAIFNQNNTDCGLKLLFYFGLQSVGNQLIPQASNTRYNYAGDVQTDFSLRWNGDDGLYNTFAKNYYERIAFQDVVTMKFDIDTKILFQIIQLFIPQRSKQKVRKIRVQNRYYLPDEFHFVIGHGGIEECEGKLKELM